MIPFFTKLNPALPNIVAFQSFQCSSCLPRDHVMSYHIDHVTTTVLSNAVIRNERFQFRDGFRQVALRGEVRPKFNSIVSIKKNFISILMINWILIALRTFLETWLKFWAVSIFSTPILLRHRDLQSFSSPQFSIPFIRCAVLIDECCRIFQKKTSCEFKS